MKQGLREALSERGYTQLGAVGGRTWIGAGVALAAFAVVGVVGSWPVIVALNVDVLRAFQTAFPFGTFDAISLLLVFGASQVSLGLLTLGAVWLFWRGQRLVALSFGFVLVGVGLEVILKATLGHPMVWGEFSHGSALYPFPEVETTVVDLVSPFPSGHVFRATYLAMTLVAVLVEGVGRGAGMAIKAAVGLFVAGVVFGVLYLGWHWPTDALGGLLLAYALTSPTRWAVAWSERRAQSLT